MHEAFVDAGAALAILRLKKQAAHLHSSILRLVLQELRVFPENLQASLVRVPKSPPLRRKETDSVGGVEIDEQWAREHQIEYAVHRMVPDNFQDLHSIDVECVRTDRHCRGLLHLGDVTLPRQLTQLARLTDAERVPRHLRVDLPIFANVVHGAALYVAGVLTERLQDGQLHILAHHAQRRALVVRAVLVLPAVAKYATAQILHSVREMRASVREMRANAAE
mmetsp:Transcript_55375/g.144420  ORF Transcript_55375/g.144420 Transcript_55375/m.144420 type:complete len:222 (+) Transcript_55375:3635-4300(+)